MKNKPVQIGFNGKVYDRVSDKNGQARLQINLKNAGTYTFAVAYLGDDDYNGSFIVAKIVVKKQKGSLTVPAKSYKASAKTKTLTATFESASGKVVANKKITFTINGKSYSATTNDKGVASVKVSLNKKGTYSFTAKFAGNNMYAAMNKTGKLTIK
ncbi:MAG: Ig-like domain-containing protein [archaeon]|nr:Ig-like domain-containing protein [archaeon]